MAQKFITEQESRTLQRQMQNTQSRHDAAIPLLPETLPLLGKADADIAALALGTFTLQKLKPDALADSTIKRDAYALSDLKTGELVSLFRYAGEASQGFSAASAVGTPLTTQDCLCLIKNIVLANFTLTDAEQTQLADLCGMCEEVLATTCAICDEGTNPDVLSAVITAVDNVQPDPFGVNWSGFLSGTFDLNKIASDLQCDRGNDGNEIDCGTITENYLGSLYAIGSPARIQLQHQTFVPSGGLGGGARIIARFEINDGGFGTWFTEDELHVNFVDPTPGQQVRCHQLNSPYAYVDSIGGTIPPLTSDMATVSSCTVEPA